MTRRVTRQDFRLLLIFLRIRKCENCTCVPVTCVEENLLFCFSGVVFLGLFFWGCFSGVVFLGRERSRRRRDPWNKNEWEEYLSSFPGSLSLPCGEVYRSTYVLLL